MRQNSELGLILVISGPSGVGKDTVWQAAHPCLPTFERAITCTTRPRRPHETEGVDYFFVLPAEFERMIDADELIEYASVHGNFYGIPQTEVLNRINNEKDVVCIVDVQGALRIRRLFPTALLVFIKPPRGRETEELEKRILGRSEVGAAELATRMETANWEMAQVQLYDYQIENDDVQRAARELCEVIEVEKARKNV